ncbi:unnamed protein product, partial [Scytosiphon promiscuus]
MFIFSQAANAKEAKPYDGHENAAWEKMQESLLMYMSADVASRLKLIVYHGVASTLCDGVSTDAEKIKKATDDIHPENWDKLSEEEHTKWTNAFLINYGMVFGVMLAEHADNTARFCQDVDALIA